MSNKPFGGCYRWRGGESTDMCTIFGFVGYAVCFVLSGRRRQVGPGRHLQEVYPSKKEAESALSE